MAEADGDLVRRSTTGDRDAFGELVSRYRDMVCGLAYHHLGGFDEVEDAAQETFIRAYVRLRQLRDPDRFAPWLRRIAVNVCLDMLRARRGRPAALSAVSDHALASDCVQHAERIAARLLVQQALSRLTVETRLAVTLLYIDGYSQDEVAQFLEVPVNTLRGRLQRAKRILRKEMVTLMKENLDEQKPGKELDAKVLRSISAADVWQLGSEGQQQYLGDRFLVIDGELAQGILVWPTGSPNATAILTTIRAEAVFGGTGGKPICIYQAVGNANRYYVFGEAKVRPDGPAFADQAIETSVEVRAAPECSMHVEPWKPAEVCSATLWAMASEERDRFISSLRGNVVILLDGGIARACLIGGRPGDSTGSPGGEVAIRNVGTSSLHVYRQEWPGSRYYVFGEAEVTPPGIRVKDTTLVLEARVESATQACGGRG